MINSNWYHGQKLDQKETLQTRYDLTVNETGVKHSKIDASFISDIPALKRSSVTSIMQDLNGEIRKQEHYKAIEAPSEEVEKGVFRIDILQSVLDYKIAEMAGDAMMELRQVSGTRLEDHPDYEEIRHEFKQKMQVYEEIKSRESNIIEEKIAYHQISDSTERESAFKHIKSNKLQIIDSEHDQLKRLNGYVPSETFAGSIQGRRALEEHSQDLITTITNIKHEKNDIHIKLNQFAKQEVKYQNESEKRLDTSIKSYNREEERYLNEKKNIGSSKEEFILDTTWSSKQKKHATDIAKLLNELQINEPPKELKHNFSEIVSNSMQEIKKVPEISKNAEMFR